ncbi:hypothetical protein TL16_g12110 [Triparma laevis f. inornata]|uniref:Uncharacterized protein n=1 Tax=Triparma laevis f. inornata TaxID=1714386 RepID=A0A9W7BJ38_9STRA|nr:hypothetical protein TL16_g12110 [Triparma laevis f. inornata]
MFKTLPDILGSLLYISASSMQCIMDSKPEDELDENGHIKSCQNPSEPTIWVSYFLLASWVLSVLIPPLLPSDRTLTWSDVMKLDLGSRIEELQFTLFCMFSIEALIMYSLTNSEGEEMDNFLGGLVIIMLLNFSSLAFIVLYEYVIKPLICKSSTRATNSPSVMNPDAFNFAGDSGRSMNAL